MRKEGTGVPSDKVFTIAEAVKLLKGEYHEEVEAADQNDGDITGKPTKANKAVFIGHRDNLNDELNVQQYEEAIKDVIQMEAQIDIDRNAGDCIPEHLRNEFALPNAKEMEGFDIDFNEVR